MGSATRTDLTRTVTISADAHNTAASAAKAKLDGLTIVGIVCPSAVGASVTKISPQVSFDNGTTWQYVYDEAGNQLEWAVADDRYVDLYKGGNMLPRVREIRLVVDNSNGNGTTYTLIAAVV